MKLYSEKILKMKSVEGFLKLLSLQEEVTKEFGTIEKFVASHF